MFHTVYNSYESVKGGRDYIGKHSAENPYDDYKGSFVDQSFNPSDKIIMGYSKTEEGAVWLEIMWQKVFGVVEDAQYANRSYQTSTGFKNTHPETRLKMSKSKSGENNPWFGKKRPDHSALMKGENNPFFGKTHTQETRDSWSEKYSGENARFFGREHTEETKQKMSDWQKGVKKGPCSEERKVKLSKSMKKMLWWVNCEGIRTRSRECPGAEWRPGRCWRES